MVELGVLSFKVDFKKSRALIIS